MILPRTKANTLELEFDFPLAHYSTDVTDLIRAGRLSSQGEETPKDKFADPTQRPDWEVFLAAHPLREP